MNRATGSALLAVGLAALTLSSYFFYPGHTWLQQDSQIYTAILEHLWDQTALRNDILVQRPHVAFTLYDEIAIALRWLTGGSFHGILAAGQLLTRGLGLWGVYLTAAALLSRPLYAVLVTAIFSLGAEIAGPSVLTFEYEPTPRAFAVPLLFLAIGLIASQLPVWASVVASLAFLLHPPSVYPFWLVLFVLALVRRKPLWLVPPATALVLLFVAARVQTGGAEQQVFFARIGPELEAIQRLRASYNWVSLWWRDQLPQYLGLLALASFGLWRLRRLIAPDLRFFLFGLPAIGILSMPVSWLLLEHWKWLLMPQLQPARALLFVTSTAVLVSAAAACYAAQRRRYLEALLWILPPCLIPFQSHGYPQLHNSDLDALSSWARTSTAKDSVFLFPDCGKSLDPGIFRSEALRAVYVDWKGGGQVNYLKELGFEWWHRWQLLNHPPASFRPLGVDYVVLQHPLAGAEPLFRNSRYLVYRSP